MEQKENSCLQDSNNEQTKEQQKQEKKLNTKQHFNLRQYI